MQVIAERIADSKNGRLIVLPKRMGAQAPLPPPQAPQPPWNTHWYGNLAQWVAPAITLIIGIIMIGLQIHYRNADKEVKISDAHINDLITDSPKIKEIGEGLKTVTSNVAGLTTEINNLKIAVETLADNQTKETQRIIERILHAAQTSPPRTSARLVDSATSLILVARQDRIPADQQYFKNLVSILNSIASRTNNPPLDEAVYSSRISLAEYSSALQSPPPHYGELVFGAMEHAVRITGGRDQIYEHARWDFRKVTGNAIVLVDNPINVTFKDSIIEGGTQTLDGIKWHGVTFIGSRISYQDGYTELENVRFVNCTFEVPHGSLQGQHFLEMATLNLPKFVANSSATHS